MKWLKRIFWPPEMPMWWLVVSSVTGAFAVAGTVVLLILWIAAHWH